MSQTPRMMGRSRLVDRYSEVVENYVLIHAGPSDGYDMTLCGVALEGEHGDNVMQPTRRRITCGRCVGIIRYCKSIPARLLNSALTPAKGTEP